MNSIRLKTKKSVRFYSGSKRVVTSRRGHLISLKFDQIGFASKFDILATFSQSIQSVFDQVLFFQRNRCTREFDGAVFRPKNAQTTLCLKSGNICLQEDESRFDVSMRYWKLSSKIKKKNDSVTNCFYTTLI